MGAVGAPFLLLPAVVPWSCLVFAAVKLCRLGYFVMVLRLRRNNQQPGTASQAPRKSSCAGDRRRD
ncbi:hypothetical protein K402DRAFT_389085 [Aulographum hederae CBS 113979]|uniref:Uncharacterized protein n=1 Tax=Aulographum hederae CBS 113979 TaxID=1176131 RepID=A0A6G1HEN9_9PEZI|nr:hypothetical protein K402DRAFT_389085 [Aulographum hederae CBS 113979]